MNDMLLIRAAEEARKTKLLMHFDAVGTRNYTCEMGTVINTPGNAGLIQADGKFSGCGFFTKALPGVVSAELDWNPEGGDWTFEFWINRFGVGNYGVSKSAAHNAAHVQFTNEGNAQFYINGVLLYTAAAHVIGLNAVWAHVAFERHGSICRIYTNGVVRYSTNIVEQPAMASAVFRPFNIMYGDNQAYDRRVDELRVSRVARYMGAFTPATAAFIVD